MKFSLITLITLAATVSAQGACKVQADKIPACGQTCIETAAGCAKGDYKCICQKRSAIIEKVVACISNDPACKPHLAATALNAEDVCKCAGAV